MRVDGDGPRRRNQENTMTTQPPIATVPLKDLVGEIIGHRGARRLLQTHHSIRDLASTPEDELAQIPYVTRRNARALKAAIELASRWNRETLGDRPLLDNPQAVATLLREETRAYRQEHLRAVLLDTRRRLIAVAEIGVGGLDGVYTSPREILAPAVAKRAHGLILVHNHPSGDPTPSSSDISMTRRVVEAGGILGIEVVDHIIFGQPTKEDPTGFVSLRELGYAFAK